MKKIINSLLLCVFIMFVASCNKDEINDINSRLDSIETQTVSNIRQQIDGINKTVYLLQNTDADVKEYISTLQNALSTLQKSLNDANVKIDKNQSESQKQVKNLRATTDEKIVEINSLIGNLISKNNSLNQMIESTRLYATTLNERMAENVDEKAESTKDWVETTFATLEQHNKMADQLAGVKVTILEINNSMEELEQQIKDKIANDISVAENSMSLALKDSLHSLTNAYETAISEAVTQTKKAYSKAIESAIDQSENSMKSWINGLLTGYYTIAEADAKADVLLQSLDSTMTRKEASLRLAIDSIKNDILVESSNIDSLYKSLYSLKIAFDKAKDDISILKDDLQTQKEELTTAYVAAIEHSIEELKGEIDDITEAKVVEINQQIVDGIYDNLETLESKVSELGTDITTIQSQISSLRTDIDAIFAMVQSVNVIPDYSDGSVSLLKLTPKENKFRFEIYPQSAAEALAELGKNAFSMRAVYTQTRSSNDFVDMAITDVSYSDGIITVTADASNIKDEVYYSKNGISVNGRLSIANSKSELSSPYFLMTPTVPGAVDLGLSVWWATCDLGANSPEESGTQYVWGNVTPYNGVELPTPFVDDIQGTQEENIISYDIQGTEYDVATSVLGGQWCLPSRKDFEELKNNTTMTHKNGCFIFEARNGKKIVMKETSFGTIKYWTSYGHFFNNTRHAWYYLVYENGTSKTNTFTDTTISSSNYSSHVCSVRPICVFS